MTSSTALAPGYDLVLQRPGHAVLAKLASLHAQSTIAGGALTQEFVDFAVGFVGEEIVAARLAQLGPSWRVLHSVPIGNGATDIDHVVIGPAGVFTINTKHHPGGRLQTKCGDTVFLGPRWVPYARKSRAEAAQATTRLFEACRFPHSAQPIIAIVGARVDARLPLEGVTVLDADELVDSLLWRPPVLTCSQVDHVFAAARRSAIWTARTPVPVAPEWVAFTARAVASEYVSVRTGHVARTRGQATHRRRPQSAPSGGRVCTSTRPTDASRAASRDRAFRNELKRKLAAIAVLIGLLLFAKPLTHAIQGAVASATPKSTPTQQR